MLKQKEFRHHYEDEDAVEQIKTSLIKLDIKEEPVFVCVGTDRSTGDCLAPLVGHLLSPSIRCVGSLYDTVHAQNLDRVKHIKRPIIAVDAGLGKSTSLGHFIIQSKPLRPGSALNKDLPEIGDYNITGFVNVDGEYRLMILNSTPLQRVYKMAEVLAQAIEKYIFDEFQFLNNW